MTLSADKPMDEGWTSSAMRLCPNCGVPEAIGASASVWPLHWQCAACRHSVAVENGIPLFAPELAASDTGFDAAVFAELAQHETGHFWFEPRNRLLTGLAAKFFPHAQRFLEIGCGTGFVLEAFARTRTWTSIAGSELHPDALIHAVQRLNGKVELAQMDARHIPARGAFDLVGAFDVLEHIQEDIEVVGEVFAALASGGGFIAAVPQHHMLWSEADAAAHHVRRYFRGELEGKLRQAGFEILFSSSYSSVVLPLMVASRFTKRRLATAEQTVVHELAVHPFVNAVLLKLLNFEVAVTLGGSRWPVGGSRIVVARKA